MQRNSFCLADLIGRLISPLLAIAALSSVSVSAQSLTGRVTDPVGVPIAGITVDTGSGLATTDALGVFVITPLAINTYEVEYLPAIGAPWESRLLESIVSGATNIGDVVLQPGFDITGVAMSEAGLPVASCNLNIYAQDGTKLFTPYDNTDALGNFAVTVPAGTWDVRVQPPVGAAMVSTTIEDVVVAGAVGLGTVTMRTGYVVSGSVVDSVSGVPIGSTRFRATNALTGERFVVPADTANVFGQFSFLLPFGIVDLDVIPPQGNAHVAREMFGVFVPGATVLGAVGLDSGAMLSGTVTVGGVAFEGADIDVLLADGTKVFTAFDTSALNGTFSVVTPLGSGLRLRVEPVSATGLVGVLMPPISVAGPTSVGVIDLQSGVAVSGIVMGPGAPEFDAALRFVDTVSGQEVVTVHDHTDVTGNYTTFVPAGNYDVAAVTVDGSLSLDGMQNVTVAAAATVDFALALKTARTQVTSYGTPTVGQGGPLPINVLLHTTPAGLTTIRIDVFVDMPNGVSVPLLFGLPLSLPAVPFVVGPVFLALPPVPAGQLGKPLKMRVRLRDATGAITYDEADQTFFVQ
ncbi:MAG: hypothetical protein ACI89X_001506 [Planctomycetota bacterium]|jgi:hypothetical protein